jgi:hypothetical protein
VIGRFYNYQINCEIHPHEMEFCPGLVKKHFSLEISIHTEDAPTPLYSQPHYLCRDAGHSSLQLQVQWWAMTNSNNTMATIFLMIGLMLSNLSLLGNDPRTHGCGSGGADNNNNCASYFNMVDPGLFTRKKRDWVHPSDGRDDARLEIGRIRSALVGCREGTTVSRWLGLLSTWSAVVRDNSKDIAAIMMMESGKPLHKSRGEVAYSACFFNYYAAEALHTNFSGGGTICPPPLPTLGPVRPGAGSLQRMRPLAYAGC